MGDPHAAAVRASPQAVPPSVQALMMTPPGTSNQEARPHLASQSCLAGTTGRATTAARARLPATRTHHRNCQCRGDPTTRRLTAGWQRGPPPRARTPVVQHHGNSGGAPRMGRAHTYDLLYCTRGRSEVRWAGQAPPHPHFSDGTTEKPSGRQIPTHRQEQQTRTAGCPTPPHASSTCQPHGGTPAHRPAGWEHVGRRDGGHRRRGATPTQPGQQGGGGAADSEAARGRGRASRGVARARGDRGDRRSAHSRATASGRTRANGAAARVAHGGWGREITVGILAVPLVGRSTGAAPPRPPLAQWPCCAPLDDTQLPGCLCQGPPCPPAGPLVVVPFFFDRVPPLGAPQQREDESLLAVLGHDGRRRPFPPLQRRRAP